MERIYSLIDKLYQQKNEQLSPAHLLHTVQLLQTELSKLQSRNGTLGTRKVAVTLPQTFAEEVVRTAMAEIKEEAIPEVIQPVVEKIYQPESPKTETFSYSLPKPLPNFSEEVRPQIKEEPVAAVASNRVLNPAFDVLEEVLVSQKPVVDDSLKKEVHELISIKHESLNDRLKEEKKELAHVLTGAPIKDLKKAIGINERFTLVNDLFRGDEPMYERSIKTINGFHIYSEAEYWINRELKYKLGWNDNNPTVQHFYHLVRRRFS